MKPFTTIIVLDKMNLYLHKPYLLKLRIYCFLFQTENTVDINVKNTDGLTPLLLVTRDVQLFDKLGDRILKGYDPVDVCGELLSHRASVPNNLP